jgi:hypothetical protein
LSGAKEVHIVWDGLASIHKRETQIQRSEHECYNCYQLAQYFTGDTGAYDQHSRLRPALHLWGESIIQEAISDLRIRMDRDRGEIILFNHCAPGEAESYIAHLGCSLPQNSDKTIVLSNDTDLLVYDSIPGFIPFETLIFEIRTETKDATTYLVTGWMYTNRQFHMAFPFLQAKCFSSTKTGKRKQLSICNYCMVAVATLAGCDYHLSLEHEACLYKVRQSILSCDIGGLRMRDRNSPSKKNALIATIRCVSHMNKSILLDDAQIFERNEYLSILASALLNYLRKIPANKLPTGNRRKKGNNNASEKDRDTTDPFHLIQTLFQIAVIYDQDCSNLESTTPCLHSVDVNLRRILNHGDFYCKNLVELQPSIWQEDVFSSCRARFYAAISTMSKSKFDNQSMNEYVHVRQGLRDFYHKMAVDFSEQSEYLESLASAQSHFMVLLGFVLGSSSEYSLSQDALLGAELLALYACRLLNSYDMKSMLLATAFIAFKLSENWEGIHITDMAVSTDDKIIFLSVYNRLQVALFHANLVSNSLLSFFAHSNHVKVTTSRFLSDELLIMTLWQKMRVIKWTYNVPSRDLLFEIICNTVHIPSNANQQRLKFYDWWETWLSST